MNQLNFRREYTQTVWLMAIVLWHEGQKVLLSPWIPRGSSWQGDSRKRPRMAWEADKGERSPGEYRGSGWINPPSGALETWQSMRAIKTAEALGNIWWSRKVGRAAPRNPGRHPRLLLRRYPKFSEALRQQGRQKAQAQDARRDARKPESSEGSWTECRKGSGVPPEFSKRRRSGHRCRSSRPFSERRGR